MKIYLPNLMSRLENVAIRALNNTYERIDNVVNPKRQEYLPHSCTKTLITGKKFISYIRKPNGDIEYTKNCRIGRQFQNSL